MGLIGEVRDPGRVAEPAPPTPERAKGEAVEHVSGAVRVRPVDAGSCDGCEIEIGQAFSPVDDAERYGIRLVASPRPTDALVATGPVTRNLADALRETCEAAPRPCRVVALGARARDRGRFADGHGVAGPVSDFVPVDAEAPGRPPAPQVIVTAPRGLSGR